MTAPDRRRPLPALVAIAALTLLTALVWFRVLHRGAEASSTSSPSSSTSTSACPTPASTAANVLPKPSLVTLIVLNSTTRGGLAKNVRQTLVSDGFAIPAQATNDGTAYGGHGEVLGVAEIRFGPSQRLAANLTAYYLPGAILVATDSSSASVIVSLGAKFKAVATPTAVAAAITKARVTLTSPAPKPSPTRTC
jgi:hypothetical protein